MNAIKNVRTLAATITTVGMLAGGANAALILEFDEVGDDVVLSFSGSVDLSGSFVADWTVTGEDGHINNAFLTDQGLGYTTRTFLSNSTLVREAFSGTHLLASNLISNAGMPTVVTGNSSIGLTVLSGTVNVGFASIGGGFSGIIDNDTADISFLSADPGGNLFGLSNTFTNTDFASLELDNHTANTAIDLWRVTGTTGLDNLIQFRVNSSSVPEPSSILLLGLGVIGVACRRARKPM